MRGNEQGFTWYELGRSKRFETSGAYRPWIVLDLGGALKQAFRDAPVRYAAVAQALLQ